MKKLFLILLCALSFSVFAKSQNVYKLEASNPIYLLGVQSWYGDHDPGTSETTDAGFVSQYDTYINWNTGKMWMNSNPTYGVMAWIRVGNSEILNPTSISLVFGTSRTPNSVYDTAVTVSIAQTSTVLIAADVLFQINYGSGFTTIGEFQISGLAASLTQTSTFLIPAGASYKIINNSGTNSISNLNEVTL